WAPPPAAPPSASPSPTAASPTAAPSPIAHATTDWTTFMGDQARSGIGPALPPTTNAHRTWTAAVDGDVYGAPLVAGSAGIATTEQDSVYSLDAATGAVRWRTHLGTPVPLASLECGDIVPNGVTSTPVID